MNPIPLFDARHGSGADTPANAFVIDLPPKIWRPKPKSSYRAMELATEFDDDLFVFPQYGTSLRRSTPSFAPTRTDVQAFLPERDMDEFLAGFRIGCDVDPAIVAQVSALIQRRWDCFYE
jgi:hypothetical protein